MNKFLFLAAITVSCAAGAADDEGLVEEKTSNPWHFRVGPVMAPRVRVKMSGPRFALPVMPKVGSRTGGVGGDARTDNPDVFAERVYDDGYVRPDEGTADEHSMHPGRTWDFAADDLAAQYTGSSVEFHTGMTRWEEIVTSASSFDIGSSSESDRDVLLGVEAMGGWTFWDNRTFDAALDAGFRFYGSGVQNVESRHGTSVTTMRNEYRQVDSYKTPDDWPVVVPAGPYQGDADGGGALLEALPTRREELMGSSSSTERHYYSGSTKLNYNIWDLRLGPTLGWHATDWLAIRGGVYGLLGLVSADLKTDVGTGTYSRSSSKSTCDAIFGMAFALSAQINLTENFFIYGSTEYDWWTDSVRVRNDGASAQLKLSDFTVSAGIGLAF